MMVSEQIVRRIERARPGWVFTRNDLVDLGSPHAVGMVLLRLVRSGRIRRIARGLYDIPRTHRTLGVLAPSPEAVAEAIARRDGTWIQPAEAMAANLLGLSEQVPAKIVYETDGPRRTVRVGRLEIQFVKRPA
jgi:predicted transcriptional regulator of viral defense system